MSIKLYSYWRSSAAYRVRIALNLKGLEHQIEPVSLAPGQEEHQQAAYRQKNPQMLVPFLEDGDVAIGQSMAMLEYLEETYPEVRLLPEEHPLRSQVRAFCNVIACDIHPILNLRILKYIKTEFDADPAAHWYEHWIHEGFKALEQFASDGPFVFGDQPTLPCWSRRCTTREDSKCRWMIIRSSLQRLTTATSLRRSRLRRPKLNRTLPDNAID